MKIAFLLCAAIALVGCDRTQKDANSFLGTYNTEYKRLRYASALAEWSSNTHIVDGDSTNAVRTKAANKALLAFVGSTANIDSIKQFLAKRDKLQPVQVRQLEKMLYNAAEGPATIAPVVAQRVAAEAEQTETLYGFQFKIANKPVTPNDIDKVLRESTDLTARRRA